MSDQVQEIFLTQEQSKYINSKLPRGYSLQFSSSHTRRVQMNPNATKLNQYEQTLIQERLKQTRSKMNQAANNAQNAAASASQNKNDKDKKLQSKKENIPEREQIADSPESGNTKKRKQQEKILEKQAAKSQKQQNQVLQQVISVDTQSKGTNSVSEDIRVCFSILQQLKKNENSGPFQQKVDTLAQQCPDYYKIIKDPMDLSKVESNLKQGFYQTTLQFANDVRKIWSNSFTYNQKGSQIYKMTEEMAKLFEKIYTQVKTQSLPNPMEYQDSIDASSNSINNNTASSQKKRVNKSAQNVAQQYNQIQQLSAATAPINQTSTATTNPTKQEKQKKTKQQAANQIDTSMQPQQSKAKDNYQIKLTQDEVSQVYQGIGQLKDDDTKQLYEIIKDHCVANNESIELNIDNLPVKVAREVQEFVLLKTRAPSQQQVNQVQQQQQFQQQQQLQQQQIQQQKQQQTQQDEQQDNKKKKKAGKLEKKDIPLTINEKKQLGISIRRLPPEDLNGIWSIVQDSQQNSEVIEFDIDTLPVRKARELEAYVKQRTALQKKKQCVQKNQSSNQSSQQITDNGQLNSVQQAQPSQPQSSASTTTTTANTNQASIATSVNSFPQQTNFSATQQYPASAYTNNATYPQANQLIQNNGSTQNAAAAKVGSNQMMQQGQYVQANSVAQSQLPITQAAAAQQNMTPISGYNHLNQQQYAQQQTYQNQMMMNQYSSAFPIQQPLQSTVIGGYQGRPSQQYDASQQGMALPSMINQTQQPYSGQQYNQQGQTQYQGYGNNMQNMYMNQPINSTTNGNHNRSIVPNQQIQYGANSQVQNGISQYPQQQNYYNAQYQSNPSQYQQHIQSMNVNQQYGNNHNQTQYGGHAQQNQNNSEQSSEGMLSESEEE